MASRLPLQNGKRARCDSLAGEPEFFEQDLCWGRSAKARHPNDDASVADARAALGPQAIIGQSTHSEDQIAAADARDIDYFAVGPVWETPSKADADAPIGLAGLRAICAAVDLPVVAIGGIDVSNVSECIRAGAAGVAVVRAATDAKLREIVDVAIEAR